MKYLFICFTLTVFSSCIIQRRIYSPTLINIPSLKQKNDHSFSLTYSGPSGFDFTGGYAITNRLAIIGGGFIHKNRDRQEETSIFFGGNVVTSLLLYRHKGFHGGLGMYFPLSKKNTANFASFFGGYTKGNFRMDENYHENSALYFYKSNIGRYFLQGSISSYSKKFEGSLNAAIIMLYVQTYSQITLPLNSLISIFLRWAIQDVLNSLMLHLTANIFLQMIAGLGCIYSALLLPA